MNLAKTGRYRKDSDVRQFDPREFSIDELKQDWEELVRVIERNTYATLYKNHGTPDDLACCLY
jgi:hypothetical protein